MRLFFSIKRRKIILQRNSSTTLIANDPPKINRVELKGKWPRNRILARNEKQKGKLDRNKKIALIISNLLVVMNVCMYFVYGASYVYLKNG